MSNPATFRLPTTGNASRQADARPIGFDDRVIEAGWLGAIVVVPLYFGLYTSHQFDPDKILLFRCIVLLMLLAEALRGVPVAATDGGWRRRLHGWRERNPLLVPVSVYAAVYAIATCASISPALSFFGSYERLEGLFTFVTYCTFFLLLAAHLKTSEQIDRIVTTLVTVSVPISAYALAQHYGLDPVGWNVDVKPRAFSTMGNPIFLGAYLLMIVPFTLARLVSALGRSRELNPSSGAPWWRSLLAWTAVVVVQNALLAALVMSSDRAGIWWLAPGSAALFLLVATIPPSAPKSRTLARFEAAALCLVVALQLSAIVLSQSRGPLLGLIAACGAFAVSIAPPKRRRALAALCGTLAVAGAILGAVAFQRAASSLTTRSAAAAGPVGRFADFGGSVEVRTVIWKAAFRLLQTRPTIGLRPDDLRPLRHVIGYGPETLPLALSPVYDPRLQQLEGNAAPDRTHNDLLDHLVMTGGAGLLAYLVLVASGLRLGWSLLGEARSFDERLLAAAAIGAIAGHLVETQTGIATATTRMHFFLSLGLLVALRGQRDMESSSAPGPAPAMQVTAYSGRRGHSRDKNRAASAAGERRSGLAFSPRQRALMFAGSIATGILLEAFVATGTISSLRTLVPLSFAWLVVGLLSLAAMRAQRPGDMARVTRSWPMRGLAAAAVAWGIVANLDALSADVFYKQGTRFEEQKAGAEGVEAYAKAVRLQERQPLYLVSLGRAYSTLATAATRRAAPQFRPTLDDILQYSTDRISTLGRDGLFLASDVVLQRALQLQPLDPDHYANLGRVYRMWGEPSDRQKLALAEQYFSDAVTIRSGVAQLHKEFSSLLFAEGRLDRAVEQATIAQRLDGSDASTRVLLGDLLLEQGNSDGAVEQYREALAADPTALSDATFERRIGTLLRLHAAERLVEPYKRAVSVQPVSAAALKGYAYLADSLDRPAIAADLYRAALKIDPGDRAAAKFLARAEERTRR